jgi:DNA-binding SARP family transcriptional activator/Tfp pilus assembly protein PilF
MALGGQPVHERLWFTLLGPVRAWRGPTEVDLGPPQQRATLAALLLREGAQASVDELIDAVWGDDPPRSAEKTIRTYVYRLRRIVEPEVTSPDPEGRSTDPKNTATNPTSTAAEPHNTAAEPVIATVGNGYVMRVTADEYDLAAFRRWLARAATAQRAGNLTEAAGHLRSALDLWQGTPLAGVIGAFADVQRARLDNLRRATLEARLRLDFQQGEYQEAVVELTAVVAESPLDERFRELLMLALYRCGRQAEALATYRQAQTLLADELGIDPGPGLRTLNERILRADPELLTPIAVPTATPTATRLASVDDPEPPTRPSGTPTSTPGGPPTSTPSGPPISAPGGTPTSTPSGPPTSAPASTPGGTPLATPAQLPAAPANFAGRQDELDQLDALLPPADAPTAVVTAVVSGMAGVGKTTLALHWAHRIAHRFPDGQLYVNLRGFEPTGSAMTAPEAVRAFLESLGVPAQAVPVGLDTQTALYRSLLAGRRVLVLADNANDADQVRPLLPGAPGCLVIVTSRNHLSSLVAADGAHPVSLDHLSDVEAGQVLANRLGARRLAAEPDAVRTIVRRCSGLPLALAVVAARAAINPRFPLAAIAEELGEDSGGLDAFASGDTEIDVRDVFSWSYRALRPAAARLFRLLGLHPGADIAVSAAAGLAGLPVRETRTLLTALGRNHLITEHLPGRYSWHDLLHAYAIELVALHDEETDRAEATRRLLDHYLHTAHGCALLFSPNRYPLDLDPPAQGTVVVDITDADRASAWFTAELDVLLAAVRSAAAEGFDRHAWQLAWTVEHFLDRRGHWHDLLSTQHTALAAALRSDDEPGQARAHGGLARAHCDLGQFDDARAHLERALELFGALGDDISQANTHRSFSWVVEQQGDYDCALEHAQRALVLHRTAGDRQGQAAALNAIGWYHALCGRHDEALAHCSQALAILEVLGNRYGQADTWDSLGFAHHGLGEYQQAADSFTHAIDLYRELGVTYAEGETWRRLADSHLAAGDRTGAHRALTRALDLFEQLGHANADEARERLRELAESAHVSSPPTAL